MAKRKKKKPKTEGGTVAVIESPKPPVVQVERSEEQCDRCNARIEVKGERAIQFCRSRFFELLAYPSFRPEMSDELTKLCKNKKTWEAAIIIADYQRRKRAEMTCRYCRSCSVDLIRKIVRGGNQSDLITCLLSDADADKAIGYCLATTGLRNCSQSGRTCIMVRRVGAVYLYQYGDPDAGHHQSLQYDPRTHEITVINSQTRATLDKQFEENINSLPVEAMLSLADRLNWRQLMRMAALPTSVVKEMENTAKKALVPPKSLGVLDAGSGDDDEIDTDIFDEDADNGG